MIDSTDTQILNVLIDNSRLSYRQIAKKIGKSVATVMNRVKRLEKQKVIRSYTAIVDYDKLGYDIPVIIEVRISKGKLFDVEKKIANNTNIYGVYDVTGGSDAILIGRFTSRRTMDTFLKKLQANEFVERTETKLILNTLKEERIRL